MILLPDAGQDPGAETRASAPAQRVTQLEPLKQVTSLRLLPQYIQHLVVIIIIIIIIIMTLKTLVTWSSSSPPSV